MKWELMEDHRGKTVYETKTGAAIYISELGALPPDVTAISPGGLSEMERKCVGE
ncbi:hypothetical protein BN3564_44828 [Escherichia coli]|nr:hypothetical protein BN3564_44828 [Escherichia coli]